jgi:hypothetical protein
MWKDARENSKKNLHYMLMPVCMEIVPMLAIMRAATKCSLSLSHASVLVFRIKLDDSKHILCPSCCYLPVTNSSPLWYSLYLSCLHVPAQKFEALNHETCNDKEVGIWRSY